MWRSVAAAALLAVTLAAPSQAAAQGSSVAEASDADKARAQDLYKSGATSFEFRRWDDAMRKFKESYGVVRSPNTHMMMARAQIELGQKTEAYNELLATEAEARAAGDRYAETAVKAAELRAGLARDVALLRVDVQSGTADPAAVTVLVGGEDHPRTFWGGPYAMPAGEVEVVGRIHGAEAARQKVALVVGSQQTATLTFGGAAPPEAPPPPAPIEGVGLSTDEESGGSALVPLAAIAAGVGAGGLAVFTVFGLMNNATYDSIEQQCVDGCSRSSIADKVDQGKTQQTVANVGLIVGAVALAGAATLVIVELTRDDESGRAASRNQLAIGPGGVAAAGTF